MKHLKPLLLVVLVYLFVQSVGLYVGRALIVEMAKGEASVIKPITDNPESVSSSFKLFGYVLIMTGVLLILLKYGLSSVIRLMMYAAMMMGTALSAGVLFGDAGILLALLLVVSAAAWKNNISVVNTTLLFTISGIGALIGASLAFKPALIFLLVLSAYDLIAVFGTKHMVTLADKSKGMFPFMFLIPVGDRKLGLGTGDLAIPLAFTVSVLRDYSMSEAASTALGGLLGLTLMFAYILKKENIALPALPPLAAGLILGFLTSL